MAEENAATANEARMKKVFMRIAEQMQGEALEVEEVDLEMNNWIPNRHAVS
jgi:hypothetical protein